MNQNSTLGNKVFLIDDNKDLLSTTLQSLQIMGYEVIVATDGDEAVATFVENRSDIGIVISDVMMPRMKGTLAVDIMRRLNPTLPAIFITGYSKSEVQIDEKNEDITCVLSKPFKMSDLNEVIIRFMPA